MEQSGDALFLLGVIAILVVAVATPVILILRITPWYKKQRREEQLAKERAGMVNAEYAQAGIHVKKTFLGSAQMEGVHAGVAFTHQIEPGGKNSPPRAIISASSTLRGDFCVTRERAADSFFRRIGFAGEAQTGDAAFDGEFLLEGGSREYVRAIFADAHNRDAVRALFESGFDRVELDGGEASASKSGEAHVMDLPVVTGAVERLASLRAASDMAGAAMYRGVSTGKIQRSLAAGTVVAALLIAWAHLGTRPTVETWWDAAQRDWHAIALGCVSLVALTVVSLRGRSAAYRELAHIMAVMPVFVYAGWCAAILANQKLDASAPSIHEARLVKKYQTAGKNSISCHLEFESWRQDLVYAHVMVPCDVYNRLKPGQIVAVGTHAGRLGIEWVDSVDRSAT
jgi:hypothetical protein